VNITVEQLLSCVTTSGPPFCGRNSEWGKLYFFSGDTSTIPLFL